MMKFKGDDCSGLFHVSIGRVAADIASVDTAVRARRRHLVEGLKQKKKKQLLSNSIKAAPENENLTTTNNREPGEHTFKSWSQTKRRYLIALKPEE